MIGRIIDPSELLDRRPGLGGSASRLVKFLCTRVVALRYREAECVSGHSQLFESAQDPYVWQA